MIEKEKRLVRGSSVSSVLEQFLGSYDHPGDKESDDDSKDRPEAQDRCCKTCDNRDDPHLLQVNEDKTDHCTDTASQCQTSSVCDVVLNVLQCVAVTMALDPALELVTCPDRIRCC